MGVLEGKALKITGLDNKTYVLDLKAKPPRISCSKGHAMAREFILARYGFDVILEEITLPGCGKSVLYVDFLLPNRKLAFEVQGEQHRKYIPHFHTTPQGFRQQVQRDRLKREWLENNGFTLVELPDDRTDEWAEILRATLTRSD